MRPSKLVCVLLAVADPTHAQHIQVCLRQFKETPFQVLRATGLEQMPEKTVDSRSQNMHFEITWVQSLSAAVDKLTDNPFDIVLIDLALIDHFGITALRSAPCASGSLPIMALLDRADNTDLALKAGVNGYIVKDDMGYKELIRSMRYVLHRADIETRNQLLVAGLEATSNAIIITDRDARIEWANPAFTELTGYSFQEVLGRKPSELLKSDVHDEAFYEQMWQKLLTGGHWQGEIVNRHKDGRHYNADVGISSVLNKDGSLSGYVQVQRDITDSVVRLAISEVLRQCLPLTARFKKILEILFNLRAFDLQRKGGVFVRSKDQDYLSMFVLSGEFSDEFIEKEQRINCGSCLCGRVALSGQIIVSDDCFCDPRHEHQFANMQVHGHYIVPIASGPEVLGVLFLYTDPHPLQTESRLAMLKEVGEMMALAMRQEEAKANLENARDMAMQASLLKSAFLANMSHEIRTPMNGVLGMLDLMLETKMSDTQRDWVETAHSSAESLLEVINDILDFSKLEAGKFEIEQVDFNLVNLVDDVCALLAGRAHANGLELNCALPVPMADRWQGDPTRIRQVLTNLIGNAVKFTEQGEISVRISQTPLSDKHSEFRFEVSDTGIGISESAKALLFKPFSQADSATSRRFGGSGLGLSISKKLVELMGGTIGLTSTEGQGSCFWFTLPLEQSECSDTPEHAYDVSGKRVLVADDNATNRNILLNYLTRWGLDASAAESGSSAIIAIQTNAISGNDYDLVILDVNMPYMDGLTVAKHLAKTPAFAKIPIILLSSGDQIDIADYQNTGIVQRLLKPARQSQLFDAIVNALLGVLDGSKRQKQFEAPLPSYHGKKVLVVEDNPINQKVIIAKLSKFGISPELAENGSVALAMLTHKFFDLVLMDCQMPVMDGYVATQKLRILETYQGLPHQTIIALTATALDGEREKCLAAGMDDYLSKPIINEHLTAILARYLGMQNLPPSVAITEETTTMLEPAENIWDVHATLKHLEGDRGLLDELIGLFLAEVPQQLTELSQLQAEGNLLALANVAHSIKGTCAHFYAAAATECANSLELAARANDPGDTDFKTLTEAVINSVATLIEQLRAAKNAQN